MISKRYFKTFKYLILLFILYHFYYKYINQSLATEDIILEDLDLTFKTSQSQQKIGSALRRWFLLFIKFLTLTLTLLDGRNYI